MWVLGLVVLGTQPTEGGDRYGGEVREGPFKGRGPVLTILFINDYGWRFEMTVTVIILVVDRIQLVIKAQVPIS